MTRCIISIPTIVVVMLLAVSGCATHRTTESEDEGARGWGKLILFAAAIYLITQEDMRHGPAYVGTGAPPTNRPAYCDAPEYRQQQECN